MLSGFLKFASDSTFPIAILIACSSATSGDHRLFTTETSGWTGHEAWLRKRICFFQKLRLLQDLQVRCISAGLTGNGLGYPQARIELRAGSRSNFAPGRCTVENKSAELCAAQHVLRIEWFWRKMINRWRVTHSLRSLVGRTLV